MAYRIDKEKCVDCGYCGYICPFGAIEEKEEAGKYYYAIGEKCVGCGQCAETCPAVCISPAPGHRAIKRVHIDESKCIGCSLCKRNCPAEAVEGVIKSPFRIIESRCIRCGQCAVKCKPQAVIIEYAETVAE